MITRKIVGKGKHSTTLINIDNYDQYQGSEETQGTTQGTTQGKQKGLVTGTQLKNVNNEENEKELEETKEFLYAN